jgi:hypothetical protein
VQIVATASFFLPMFHPMADVAMPEVVPFSIAPKSAVWQSIKTIQLKFYLFMTKMSSIDQNELLYIKLVMPGVTSLCKWGLKTHFFSSNYLPNGRYCNARISTI